MEEPDLAHFRAIPWCAALLADPAYQVTPTLARQAKANTEDSLIAETLNSPAAISRWLSLSRIPPAGERFVGEVRSLVALGAGLNGGAHLLHGGIITLLIDDTMGMVLVNNGFPGSVTARLDMRFLKKVRTPGTVLVVARCTRREGRKYWMEAWMEDEKGVVLARGDALWVNTAVAKEKL
jgi:acyl-coenzyme A thioesterase PaaI-like protein